VRICGRCPVRQECLEHALDSPGLVGVWGGTTEVERKWLLRAQSP
jgi:WhiB family transcriptional regulator, redox-sensing transcriptional regulator